MGYTYDRRTAGSERRADDEIGRTILDQMGGVGRIRAMTGAKLFRLLPDGVLFTFPNPHRSRGNGVRITLQPDDEYKVEFLSGNRPVKTYDGIGDDNLIELFEKQTGVYLHL